MTRRKKQFLTEGLNNTLDFDVERLESREMLAGVVLNDGTLRVIGTAGDDTISIVRCEDQNGDEQICVRANFMDSQRTFSADDVLRINVEGLEGNDTITAVQLNLPTEIRGNGGNDRIFGSQGKNILDGGNGDDLLFGGNNDDTLYGRNGNDIIVGGDGDDRIEGGNGDDRLTGGGGADNIDGNSGNDWVSGGAGADTLFGSVGDDRLVGGDGDDLLYGGIGNDVITGDGGDDMLMGNTGDDRLIGGGGKDSLDGGTGNDVLAGGMNDDELSGGNGDDRLFGDDGSDRILGGNGSDVAYGGIGSDTIVGGLGHDSLYGGAGGDLLIGNAGNDNLWGGANSDILISGAGPLFPSPDTNRLLGEDGSDLLIQGDIDYAENSEDLEQARLVWSGSGSFHRRVSSTYAFLGRISLSFRSLLNNSTVLDGGAGQNFVIFSPVDGVSDGVRFAVDDEFQLNAQGTISATAAEGVLANDEPTRGRSIVRIVRGPRNGTLEFNEDGSFVYESDSSDGSVADFFIYEVRQPNFFFPSTAPEFISPFRGLVRLTRHTA